MDGVDYRAIERRLNEYRKIQSLIELYTLRLERLAPNFLLGAPQEPQSHVKSVKPPGEKGGDKIDLVISGGKRVFTTEDTLKEIEEDYNTRKQTYARMIKTLVDKQDKFIEMLSAAPLDDDELDYVTKRYVQGMRVKKICEECFFSEKTAWNIKQRALEKLEYLLKGTGEKMNTNIEDYKPYVDIAYIAKRLNKGVRATKDVMKMFGVDYIYHDGSMKINAPVADKFIDDYKNKRL